MYYILTLVMEYGYENHIRNVESQIYKIFYLVLKYKT